MLITVHVERHMCPLDKHMISIFSQAKYIINLKNYITLKLVQSTIQTLNKSIQHRHNW